MFFFFYGSFKAEQPGWERVGLRQRDFTEIIDPRALASGKLYLQTSDDTPHPAFVPDPIERELTVGELHKLLPMDTAKKEFLLAALHDLENYTATDILLYQPKIEALTWAWNRSIIDLPVIRSWP